MGKKVDPKVAEKVMLKAGLKPLVPYTGNGNKWKCQCSKCDAIVYIRFYSVKQGQGCRFCGIQKRANKRRNSEKKVTVLLGKAKLRQLEPYKDSRTKFKCKCLVCGNVVYPRLYSLQKGKGGCKFCAVTKRHLHFKMLDKTANKFAKKAKVIPLEPYVNQNTKWRCRCLLCGEIVTPRLADMKRYPNSLGCKKCANDIANARLKLDEKDAIAVMRKGGLEPQEPYVKANVGWKSRCVICKRIVRPSLNSIRDGGGCQYCAIGGFKPQLPSSLYLVTNPILNAHKVGITNTDRRINRLERLNDQGWQTYKKFEFKKGEEAKKCEKRIFHIIRHDLKIPIYLSKEDMPLTGGHTETISADSITLLELEKIINKVIRAN